MLTGTIIKERYQVAELIGQGGFAATYRGVDQSSGEQIAIKECKHIQPKELERIRQEAQILRDLSESEGIVHIRDYIESEEAAYIIMDYAEGETLKFYVEQNGAMQPEKALALLKPVMRSLQGIHEKGLLHRDISPDNMMLSQDGNLKLLDFGAAKSAADEDQKTMTMILKPGYAPEEQYRSLDAQGTWTDVYALCATLYFCITGKAPIDSLQRMYEDTLRSPSELGFLMDAYQESVLMHGLALRGENRIQTVGELLRDFDNLDAGNERRSKSAQETKDQGYGQRTVEQQTDGQRTVGQQVDGKCTSEKRTSRKKSSARIPKGLVIGIVAVVFLCVAAAIILLRQGGEDEDELDDAYPYYSEQLITQDDINQLKKNQELESVSFDECELSDEIMEQISEIPQVGILSFTDCYGFSSYESLAGAENLHDLTVYIYDESAAEFNGNEAFPVEFPFIENLQLNVNGYDGGIEFFKHFPSLQCLYLYNTGSYDDIIISMDDIEFVKNFAGLQSFHMEDTALVSKDISPLGECPNLTSVEIVNAGITDLSGLEKCELLYYLDVSDNQVISLELLSPCKELSYVDISYNHVTSLEGLEEAEELRNLYAAGNAIQELSILQNKKGITILDVSENQLKSLKGCEGLIDLDQLNANSNQITDLDGIANSTSLTVLQIRNNELSSLDLLADRFTELKTVDVAANHLTNIEALSSCPSLQIFRGDENELTSLKGLEGKSELYVVSAYQNQLTDVSALRDTIALQYVDLGKNQIADISALSGMTGNDLILFLEENQVSDVSVLPKENTYRFISLQGNPLPDYQNIDRFLVENIYLPDVSGENYDVLKSGHMDYLYMVDIELGKQAQMKRDFEDVGFYMELLSEEEADEDMQEMREFQRSM